MRPVWAGGSACREYRVKDSAAQRAHWLAELAEALDEARLLTEKIVTEPGFSGAADLQSQIEAARLEVLAMRLKRSGGGGQVFAPEWSETIPWTRGV